MASRIPVAVLAATGAVGQRFIQLLDKHPWFEVQSITASGASVGKTYKEACHWILQSPMPDWVKGMVVKPTLSESVDVPIAFSALPADIAKEIEPSFARAGVGVFSNASAYREEPDVPILLPEVNPDHLSIIDAQRKNHKWSGFIVTNSNCTTAGMTVALKALQGPFGIKKVFVVSMQALSGGGYPGVPSMDIIDNVFPYIAGEDDKVEREPAKILGSIENDVIAPADFMISAHTNRVAVSEGHMVCMSVELDRHADIAEIEATLREYRPDSICDALPSTPNPIIKVMDECDRPQPRLDRETGKGMTTVVGRVRKDPIFDVKMVVLSHNTVRGAAGGSLYNAELAVQQKYLNK